MYNWGCLQWRTIVWANHWLGACEWLIFPVGMVTRWISCPVIRKMATLTAILFSGCMRANSGNMNRLHGGLQGQLKHPFIFHHLRWYLAILHTLVKCIWHLIFVMICTCFGFKIDEIIITLQNSNNSNIMLVIMVSKYVCEFPCLWVDRSMELLYTDIMWCVLCFNVFVYDIRL